MSSGTIYYYEEDMLGSSRTMVQAGQTTVCYDADFYPFGGERDLVSTCTQNYKFEGKERDTETGNDDFGARYYTSRLGRWMSADWSSVPAPVPYANLANPQTLNLYAMVSDNPETFADLDGHNCGTVDGSDTVGCTTGGSLPLWAPGVPSEQPKNGTNTPNSPTLQLLAALQANQYHLSKKGLDFLKRWETLYLRVYDASGKRHLGDWTIGYGHKVLPGEDFSNGITKEQASTLLEKDVAFAVAEVNKDATFPLFQNQVDALVSFTFNVGTTGFAKSSLRARIVVMLNSAIRRFTTRRAEPSATLEPAVL